MINNGKSSKSVVSEQGNQPLETSWDRELRDTKKEAKETNRETYRETRRSYNYSNSITLSKKSKGSLREDGGDPDVHEVCLDREDYVRVTFGFYMIDEDLRFVQEDRFLYGGSSRGSSHARQNSSYTDKENFMVKDSDRNLSLKQGDSNAYGQSDGFKSENEKKKEKKGEGFQLGQSRISVKSGQIKQVDVSFGSGDIISEVNFPMRIPKTENIDFCNSGVFSPPTKDLFTLKESSVEPLNSSGEGVVGGSTTQYWKLFDGVNKSSSKKKPPKKWNRKIMTTPRVLNFNLNESREPKDVPDESKESMRLKGQGNHQKDNSRQNESGAGRSDESSPKNRVWRQKRESLPKISKLTFLPKQKIIKPDQSGLGLDYSHLNGTPKLINCSSPPKVNKKTKNRFRTKSKMRGHSAERNSPKMKLAHMMKPGSAKNARRRLLIGTPQAKDYMSLINQNSSYSKKYLNKREMKRQLKELEVEVKRRIKSLKKNKKYIKIFEKSQRKLFEDAEKSNRVSLTPLLTTNNFSDNTEEFKPLFTKSHFEVNEEVSNFNGASPDLRHANFRMIKKIKDLIRFGKSQSEKKFEKAIFGKIENGIKIPSNYHIIPSSNKKKEGEKSPGSKGRKSEKSSQNRKKDDLKRILRRVETNPNRLTLKKKPRSGKKFSILGRGRSPPKTHSVDLRSICSKQTVRKVRAALNPSKWSNQSFKNKKKQKRTSKKSRTKIRPFKGMSRTMEPIEDPETLLKKKSRKKLNSRFNLNAFKNIKKEEEFDAPTDFKVAGDDSLFKLAENFDLEVDMKHESNKNSKMSINNFSINTAEKTPKQKYEDNTSEYWSAKFTKNRIKNIQLSKKSPKESSEEYYPKSKREIDRTNPKKTKPNNDSFEDKENKRQNQRNVNFKDKKTNFKKTKKDFYTKYFKKKSKRTELTIKTTRNTKKLHKNERRRFGSQLKIGTETNISQRPAVVQVQLHDLASVKSSVDPQQGDKENFNTNRINFNRDLMIVDDSDSQTNYSFSQSKRDSNPLGSGRERRNGLVRSEIVQGSTTRNQFLEVKVEDQLLKKTETCSEIDAGGSKGAKQYAPGDWRIKVKESLKKIKFDL